MQDKVNQPPSLDKSLGVVDVFCIASGAMISSGLFVLPGLVYFLTGPAACLVYLLAGLIVIPALLCKIELATAMPKAGGDYFFIDRSLGAAFGTLGGIASWFSLSLKSAFALFGIGAFGLILYPHMSLWSIKLVAIACCLVVTVINIMGVRHAGRLQTALVVLLFSGLVLYIFRGLMHMEAAHFEDFTQRGWSGIWTATGLVFVSYGGLTKVASMAEEVRNPGRTLPVAMFTAFGVVTFFYVLVVLVTVGLLGDRMSGLLNPLVVGAQSYSGTVSVIIISAAALLAYASTGNAGVMSASRIPMAMSRDQLLPASFARVHPTRRTPVAAIWFTSLFMVLAIIFLDLEMLVKVASTMKIILFLLVCLAVILMRESHIENYRPQFLTPFYPYIPVAGIIAYSFLLLEMGFIPLILTSIFFAVGLLWYGFYGRIRVNRESALVGIVKRVVPSRLSSSTLEGELRTILQARDGIVEDRFDKLVRECAVLDIEEALSVDVFFEQAAEVIADKMGMAKENIARLLKEREEETSTVLKPGLAIPHIVVPGENQFHLLVARAKQGILFRDESTPVQAVFVLAGSEDLRNYHLRVLMYIAQITQETTFEHRWLHAPNTETLRDLILLAKRTREPGNDAALLEI